jgi:Zn-dependent M28 family amino/carboxypeptidase
VGYAERVAGGEEEPRAAPGRVTPGAESDRIWNGADDDGSGSMAMLEIAEAIARMDVKPRRSVLFVWHTGEEAGLLGAAWFTGHPTVPRDSIVTALNIDMIGRGGPDDLRGGGPGYVQLIGSRKLSTQLGDLVEQVNTQGNHGMVFDYQYDADGHPQQYYCRSDHYSYARYGIPVVFFSTGGHRDYHMVTDEPQYIDYEKLAKVTGFIGEVGKAVANLDQPPAVDKPRPDPKAECKQ